MKYIIEFEDEPYMREDGVNYYTCKSAHWYKLGDTIINRLEPYTEPDRKAIEDEVWGFASSLMTMHPDVAEDIYWSMNGGKGIGVAAEMTYQEAKSKYEAWLKKKDEIHVGDEVIADNGLSNGFVTRIDEYKDANIVWKMGGTGCVNAALLHKTGRTFPEVAELLEKMRGES